MQAVDKDKIAEELENERKIFGRSLGLVREFKKGEIVQESDFCFRKPSGGLLWGERRLLIGKKLNKNVELGEIIQLEHFD
jgi:sialic acid synthase SpsE